MAKKEEAKEVKEPKKEAPKKEAPKKEAPKAEVPKEAKKEKKEQRLLKAADHRLYKQQKGDPVCCYQVS